MPSGATVVIVTDWLVEHGLTDSMTDIYISHNIVVDLLLQLNILVGQAADWCDLCSTIFLY